MANPDYKEKITDWVLQFCEDQNPNHAQISATQAAYLIMEFNQQKLNGTLKL